jgi:hypothetical protein
MIRTGIDYVNVGKTMKSVLISCRARLAPFDIGQLWEIITYEDLELDRMGLYNARYKKYNRLFHLLSFLNYQSL